MRYEIQNVISINKLITCYYFELAKNYRYAGEKHDFWELYYVDKGEMSIETDFGHFNLKQGDLLFHEPNEFHSPRSNGVVACNVFIVTFECDSSPMSFFLKQKLFHLGDYERSLLSQMMKEGFNAFGVNPFHTGRILSARENAPFGSEQMFRINLETLLIRLIRNSTSPQPVYKLSSAAREKQEMDTTDKILAYMEENIGQNLTLDHLCEVFTIGRTQLSILFKKRVGRGVMEHSNDLKIQKAKVLIREEDYNLTEISELLGYSSVHYFSRHFKKATGMTPSEYAKSLRAGFSRYRPH
ncbi:AraC family transcriptional regulator [Paenibacillus aurantius]|uniref:AraC family transcriptional regulator n=1 Tax=Paenibacillus aurantius TaxID=2918900 RepID=A0AA96LJ35_9BACL|nr:AraC family transcriptional regulator [Paenibacillus aurantius]WJH37522.1 AraC family transcriptional regulator [Paenibacillus sp. CC-CFT747]WNQ14258.1 AraC family transcriptional regulator [Paenibacillus aurantius]